MGSQTETRQLEMARSERKETSAKRDERRKSVGLAASAAKMSDGYERAWHRTANLFDGSADGLLPQRLL